MRPLQAAAKNPQEDSSATECVKGRFVIPFDVSVLSQVKQDFFDLLSDQHIEGSQRWSKVKERLETDPRYKAVESSALREELFKQFIEKQAKVGASHWILECGLIYDRVMSALLQCCCKNIVELYIGQ